LSVNIKIIVLYTWTIGRSVTYYYRFWKDYS